MKEKSVSNSSLGGSRPSPGLTLASLSFKNFPKQIPKKQQKIPMKEYRSQPYQDKSNANNLYKYSRGVKDEELQRNLANYELFFEKNQKKKKNILKAFKTNNKSDIYVPNNYKDSNADILSKILDSNEEFSPNSPSNLKIYQNEMNDIKNNKNNENENINTSSQENSNETYINCLNEALKLLDPVFESLSLNEKIEKLISLSKDERREARLGSLIALYLICKKYSNEIDEEHKGLIIENVVSLLQTYEKQEELFLVACLEICSLYGPIDILIENIGLICMFITDFNFPKLQKATFYCLMNMEYEGIKTLIELASKDYQDYQNYILNALIQTPHIQKTIIIKALLNEVYSNNFERRNIALSAINRMHELVNDTDTLEKIDSFFDDPKIRKDYIASILRTAGREGEEILLEEIKYNKDPEVRKAIANCFSYRIPKNPKYLDIKLDKNDIYSITKNLPGSFYKYHGKICPVIEMNNKQIEELLNEEEEGNELNSENKVSSEEEYLEVNTRDFLAALQRMLSMNYDYSFPQLVHNRENNYNSLDKLNLDYLNQQTENNVNDENEEKEKDEKNENEIRELEPLNKYISFFQIPSQNMNKKNDNNNTNTENNTSNSNNNDLLDDNNNYLVTEDIIKSLSHCLKDYNPKVRESAARSLGIIGLPESLLSIDGLIENINDEDVNVRSKIIWAIGRIAQGADSLVIPFIIDSLQNNMWKVKKASMYALSQFGERAAKNALPYLIKILKESPINKNIIAETIVKLGLEGEGVLLKIMSNEPDSNYKLKSAIVHALAYTDINSTNIDFIVECIFRQGKNSNNLVRRSAIFSIRVLAEKADEKITYLKRKNVIPFYYDKLKDKDPNIQNYAITCIRNLGPQGELIFIEGFTKDPNPIIRANCAIGLSENGVHNMRTLLVGLNDENENVRSTTEKLIVVKMDINNVIGYFGENDQLNSLNVSIKDILEKNKGLSMFTVNYFNQLLESIAKYEAENKDNRNFEEQKVSEDREYSEANGEQS